LAWLVVVSLDGCTRAEADLAGRPCVEGRCILGYICHPERIVCVRQLTVALRRQRSVPADVDVGAPCSDEGSFLAAAPTRRAALVLSHLRRWRLGALHRLRRSPTTERAL